MEEYQSQAVITMTLVRKLTGGGGVVVLVKLSSLAATGGVILTAFGAPSDGSFIGMTTFPVSVLSLTRLL